MPQTPVTPPQAPAWTQGLDTQTPDWAKGLDARPASAHQDTTSPPASTNVLDQPGSFATVIMNGLNVPHHLQPLVWTALTRGGQAASEHPAAAGAMAAGAATAPLSGGMSFLPALGFTGLMTGGGAAAGLLAHDVANINTPGNIPTPLESAKQIGTQAALGAAGEGTGRALSWGISATAPKVAQWLYNLGLRPPKAIRDAFPSPAGVGLQEGLLPNPETIQKTLTQVESELNAAVGKADAPPAVRGLLGPGTQTEVTPLGAAPTGESAANVSGAMPRPSMIDPRRLQGGGEFGPVYANAGTGPRPTAGFGGPGVMVREVPRTGIPAGEGAPPTMVDPRKIASDATQYVIANGNLGSRAFRQEPADQLRALMTKYLQENSQPMTVAQLVDLKRAEQSIASASYLKLARGGEINDIDTLFHQGIANAARNEIINRVPGAAEMLSREQGLIGLKQAAEYAADRPEVFMRYVKAASVIGGMLSGRTEEGLATAALLHAVQSPTAAGALAILTKSLGQGASKMTPTLMKALSAAYGGMLEPVSSHGGS